VKNGSSALDNYFRLCGVKQPLSLLAVVLIFCVGVAFAEVKQPDGYRVEFYDDKVPAELDGASTITAVEVKRLQESAGAVVVDVIPENRRPKVLPENQVWFPVDHKGVPGAIWLPDTGYGVLSDITEKYFKHHLNVATSANKNHAIVFYCRTDCWMSWNAAKRALSYGYTNVYWFYNGIDEWFFENYDFEVLTPAQGQRQVEIPDE
jgi:PQQ-dependent catabolism-associated CXXCW motif protein